MRFFFNLALTSSYLDLKELKAQWEDWGLVTKLYPRHRCVFGMGVLFRLANQHHLLRIKLRLGCIECVRREKRKKKKKAKEK